MSTPRRRRAPAKRTPRGPRAPVRDFWGTENVEDHAGTVIRPSDHPTALIQSLGALPFPGGGVAQHYFDVVYERAASLAVALATSAGLLETSEAD